MRVVVTALALLQVLVLAVGCSAGATGQDPTAPSAAPAPTAAASGGDGTALLDLPRVPWEGGSKYWDKFPGAASAGWNDPSFFPIVAWYDGISSDDEAQYDKRLGFNTYIGMDAATPYSLFADNGAYWMGNALNDSFKPDAKNWAAYFLDDEVDGRFTPAEGREHLQKLRDALPRDRPAYTNYTQLVINRDTVDADSEAYVNDYSDVVSVDMYWYTIPFCDLEPFRGGVYVVPIRQETCRTASSYGATMDALRQRDATDGKLQAMWQFVELLNGGGGGGPFVANIKPDQLQGAVMSSVIHEARGVVYFNQSLSGPCQGSNVIRLSQVQDDFCGAAQVKAAGEVNRRIHDLAPVLNTQSYAYRFGPGLDTMLKVHDGDAYVFAMVDSTDRPGQRTFTLPPGVDGTRAEVMFENRTVDIAGGSFTDRFAAESSYHVYRIPLSAQSRTPQGVPTS